MTDDLAYNAAATAEVRLVPIDQIRLVNPRERNRKWFAQIVANIDAVGLKKPLTARVAEDGMYELVCGQGRLEALRQLGETAVPVVILNISREELLIMSIIENSARLPVTTMESIAELAALRDAGNSYEAVGRQVGLSGQQVAEMLHLYDLGEERLLNAVRAGEIALHSAVVIAECRSQPMQEALLRVQQEQQLTTPELRRIRKLLTARKAFGPKLGKTGKHTVLTADSIVRAVKKEQERQRETLKKAQLCEKRLVFVVNALKTVFRDEHFVTLLRAEGVAELPRFLADAMTGG